MLALLVLACGLERDPYPREAFGGLMLDGVQQGLADEAIAVWRDLGYEPIQSGAPGVIYIASIEPETMHDRLGVASLENDDCLIGLRKGEGVGTLAHEVGHCLGWDNTDRPWHLMSGKWWPGPYSTAGLAK